MSTDPKKPEDKARKTTTLNTQDARSGRAGTRVATMVIIGLILAIIVGLVLFAF